MGKALSKKQPSIELREEVKEVLFIIPARITRQYFTKLYAACEMRLSFKKFRPILRCVNTEYSIEDEGKFANLIDREERWVNFEKVVAALVVATTGELELERSIAHIQKKYKIPVYGLSLPFHHESEFDSIPKSVYCDNNHCKELGAKSAEHYQIRNGSNPPNVWLVPGKKNRKDSQERIDCFREGVKDKLSNAKFEIQGHANWIRNDAHVVIQRALQKSALPDIVFAASDLMALGVSDALVEHQMLNHMQTYTIDVYGFDYIDEVKQRLEHESEPFLRGTVSQNTSAMARYIVDLIEGNETETKVTGVCKMWVNIDSPVSNSALTVPWAKDNPLWISTQEAVYFFGRSFRNKRSKGGATGGDFNDKNGIKSVKRKNRVYYYFPSTVGPENVFELIEDSKFAKKLMDHFEKKDAKEVLRKVNPALVQRLEDSTS